MVSVVVYPLVLLQVVLIQHIVDYFSLDPQNVPSVIFYFLVALALKSVNNAILEGSFELNLGAKRLDRVGLLTSEWSSVLS
jgi:hypothetical protein